MSFYNISIDQTAQTVNQRSRNFRNLIIIVNIVVVGLSICSVLIWSWQPLYGILMLIPICGLYLYFDGIILSKWRHEILGAWEKREIDFMAFHEAITPLTTLPQETVKSMLETLPTADDLVTEQGISIGTRSAIAATVNIIHTRRIDDIGLKTLVFTLMGASIVLSAMLWKWQPFLAILFVIVFFFMDKYVKTRKVKEGYKKISHAKKQPDFDLENFLKIILTLNWQPFSESDKKSFIETLVDT